MNPVVLFQVELVRKTRKRIAVVAGVETQAFQNYFLVGGNHLVPEPAAIRAALPHQLRAAFDRAPCWFPLIRGQELTDQPHLYNKCRWDLYSTRGKSLGSVYAMPYNIN